MVRLTSVLTFAVILVFLVLPTFSYLVSAQGVSYGVTQEWVRVEIFPNHSINIFYNITFSYLSGSPQGIFTLGMPKAGYQIQLVEDSSGASLEYEKSVYTSIGIDITLKKPILINDPINFLVYATVPDMVFLDDTNPGNVGMQFFPSTFDSSMGTEELRLQIILPSGVQTTEVKSPTNLPFDNVFLTDDNKTAVYWERSSWQAEQVFSGGVSFPQDYVSPAPTQSLPPQNGEGISDLFDLLFGVGAFVVVAAIVVAIFRSLSKATYTKPQISIEALGANRTLTAVEAALVLDQKAIRILTMILYGLILKRQVMVTQTDPILKLEKIMKIEGENPLQPRYYEIDYLSAIRIDGTLDEKTLALTYHGLSTTVNQKLRGYSREDTTKYYKSIVETAWKQVTIAQTPELKGEALNQNIEWLLSDQKFDEKLKTSFPPETIITPNPAWWWYWGIPRFPTPKNPSTPPTYPPTKIPSKPMTLPGQDFANTVVSGLQSSSNNMVKNIQEFANKLIPFQPTPSHQPVNKKSCVCACHSCACACACVSCACACAGGGAR